MSSAAVTKTLPHVTIGRHLPAAALPLLTVLVAVFFTVWPTTSDVFPSAANLRVIFGAQTATAIIALGALVPLIAGEWDLSVGAVSGLVGITAVQMFANHQDPVITILIAATLGCLIGLVNAVIVTRLRVNAVITTLGVATVLDGLINQRTGGVTVIGDMPTWLMRVGTGNWLGIPCSVFVVAAAAAGVHYLLAHTPYGRQLYAIGSNLRAAQLVGLRTNVILALSFVIAGALSALGGFVQIAQAGSGNPHVGASFTLPALAAAFLSAASIQPGRYNVGGALVAVIFLAVVNSGLNLSGAPTYVSSYVNGSALILGVALAGWLGRRRGAMSL